MATQNPMDLDDRVLSNAGAWWIGRLQTDADREHVVEAVVSEGGADGTEPAPGRSGSGHPSRPLQVLEIQGGIHVFTVLQFSHTSGSSCSFHPPACRENHSTVLAQRTPVLTCPLSRSNGCLVTVLALVATKSHEPPRSTPWGPRAGIIGSTCKAAE